MKRFKIGDRVQVRKATHAVRPGQSGVIECLPAREMRATFDWCVLFEDGQSLGYRESELDWAKVPIKHRPVAVGALRAGFR